MKLGALVLVSVVLLAGCGGNSNASGSQDGGKQLTLSEVAAAACGDLIPDVEKRGNLDWFASQGATCGRTEISMFDSPGALSNWSSIAQKNGRAIVGTNWAVHPANDAVLKRIQDNLGGKVIGGF